MPWLDDVGAPEHRLIIVHVDSTNEDDMVVGVRSGARWLILDNRTMALVDSGASAYAPVLKSSRTESGSSLRQSQRCKSAL